MDTTLRTDPQAAPPPPPPDREERPASASLATVVAAVPDRERQVRAVLFLLGHDLS
jgi:hypothetical protein